MMMKQEVEAENNMVLEGVVIKHEMEEMNLCGTDDHFFDHIDDFLDFPMEDIEESLPQPQKEEEEEEEEDRLVGGVEAAGGLKGNVWPLPSIHNNNNTNTNTTTSELPAGLSHPYEDFPPLEWMSSFIDDSFSARSCVLDKDPITIDNKNNIINHNQSSINYHQFQSSSPVSVLETNSSYSGGKPMPLQTETFARGRARSKRPRPATFNPRHMIPLISPTTSSITDTATTTTTTTTTTSSELVSEIGNYADSRPMKKMSELHGVEKHKKNTKKKQRKKLPPLPGGAMGQSVRKCLHCEITKTPQWRAGPLGPKTLCNACGVRFKSGRLYPEYRPAASPTFVAAKHSNSHKKVLEMRIRGCEHLESPLIATRFPFQPVPFG